jgi:GNAT superfamily N-acetyltransferase
MTASFEVMCRIGTPTFARPAAARGAAVHIIRQGVMNALIQHTTAPFPEPEFTALRNAVFSQLERESTELASVQAQEGAQVTFPGAMALPPMFRFGAYLDGQLVGWSSGWLERDQCLYMASSGVSPEHQGQGIYSALLQAVVAHARDMNFRTVRSQHSVLNNKVIVCKLKRGFHITGTSVSAHMGTLVELVLHLSEPRLELFRTRTIPLTAPR